MAYVEHEWVNGETITAAKLNNIEEGIVEASQSGGGGALICNSSYDGDEDNFILDKTAQEIYDALLAGTPAYIKYQYGTPEDHQGTLYLAPIIKFSNYNYTEDIKIYASKTRYSPSQIDGKFGLGIASIITYKASGLDEYPVFFDGASSSSNDFDGID